MDIVPLITTADGITHGIMDGTTPGIMAVGIAPGITDGMIPGTMADIGVGMDARIIMEDGMEDIIITAEEVIIMGIETIKAMAVKAILQTVAAVLPAQGIILLREVQQG